MQVVFKTASVSFAAEFNQSRTAREIINQLPVESVVSTWGDEIYFDLGFKACAEGATMDLRAGDIAYWPQGKCLCVFFGPTPASSTDVPVPASPVVVVGNTAAAPGQLKAIQLGEKISVQLANNKI